MYTLFIDTHFKDIVIGIYKDMFLLDQSKMTSVKNHSVYTMPMIKSLLEKNNLPISRINQVIVCIGPGSFTGVRIGVTIGKVLAYALKIPIKVISSIELMALSCSNDYVAIAENNGYYYANRNNLKVINYMKKSDFNVFVSGHDCGYDVSLKYDKVMEWLKDKSASVVHDVNPLYIKKIEVLNGNN